MAPVWIPAYVGIGSNLDDPATRVRAAFGELEKLPGTRLLGCSHLYRNPPMGPPDQPWYVNAVAGMLTTLEARDLLRALHDIERAHGRERQDHLRWGPRRIDLDLLVFGRLQSADPGITVPHPGIPERNFVLFPLAEVAPYLQIPGMGPVAALTAALDSASLERVG